jgi:tellurite resistance protein TehA-like permease
MNRAFWIVLGPAALVAVGYILVLRKMGLEPPYWKLVSIVVVMGLGLWWLAKKNARNRFRDK